MHAAPERVSEAREPEEAAEVKDSWRSLTTSLLRPDSRERRHMRPCPDSDCVSGVPQDMRWCISSASSLRETRMSSIMLCLDTCTCV